MSDEFPFPVAWRYETGTDFTPRLPVLANAHSLTVRAGDDLLRLTVAGAPLWTARLMERAAAGKFLLHHNDMLLTDAVRRPDRLDSVLGVTTAGEVAWQADLPGILAPESAFMHDGELWLAVTEPDNGTAAHILDPATGHLRRRIPLSLGADGFVARSGGVLVRNQIASGDHPGLYTLEGEAVVPDPVWQASEQDGRIVVSAGTDGPGTVGLVHVFGADLHEQWSAPAAVAAVAADSDHVYTVDRDVLVARNPSDGTEVWRTDPTGRRISTVGVAGPIVTYSFLGGRLLFRAADGAPIGQLPGLHTHPVYANEMLYLIGVGYVLALAVTSGM